MPIPTELVGSLPRRLKLQQAYEEYDKGKVNWEDLEAAQNEAAMDSIKRLEATGEAIVTDGEQRKSSFAKYPITDTLAGTGLADKLAGDGQFFAIFDDGHHRSTAATHRGSVQVQKVCIRICGEEQKDCCQAHQASWHLTIRDNVARPE